MKKNHISIMLVVCFLLSLSAVASAAYAVNSNHPNTTEIDTIKMERNRIEYIPNVMYSQPSSYNYPNWPLHMDVMRPYTKEPVPAVICIAGGGFIAANKSEDLQLRMQIAEAGYVVAGIEYRVAPQNIFPAALEDVKAAIRYLRANAKKFNIDPNRIAVMGGSSGGYLTAMAGTTNGLKQFDKGENLDQSSDVTCAIDLFGPSDLTSMVKGLDGQEEGQKSASSLMAVWVNGLALNSKYYGSIQSNPERAAAANPITYISSQTTVPFLLMVGNKDKRVSPNQTKIFHEALVNNGIDSTLYILKDTGHGGINFIQPQIVNIMVDFLNKHLK